MKKIVICTFLFAAGAASLLSINSKIDFQSAKFNFKNSYAIVLGYDKSMGEKTSNTILSAGESVVLAVTPTTLYPFSFKRKAVTLLSTPPDNATAIFSGI